MKSRVLLLLVLSALAAAACDEDPPETGYDTETPFESPSPGVTPVGVVVAPGTALTFVDGQISAPGERDQFTFSLTNGDDIRIDVDAQGIGSSLIDPVVTVYAPDGSIAGISADGTNAFDPGINVPNALKDPYLYVSADATGLYTLVLEDEMGNGAANIEFDYRIVFSRIQAPTSLAGGIACGSAVLLPVLNDSASVLSITGSIDPITSTDSCCGAQVLPCVGAPVAGKDVIYKATLTSGSRVQVTRTGAAFDGAVYATTDCQGNQPDSIKDSCKAGADSGNATDGFVFTPSITGDYYIFVDAVLNPAGSTGSGGAFTLDMRILPQP